MVKCAAGRGNAACTAGAVVPVYRCYFLDSADRVAATDLIACDTDAEAQARADIRLEAGDYPGIEVWDRDRRVYRALKTGSSIAPKSPPEPDAPATS
jgi:hypothetical protein